jgi:hypothetical protein
MIRTAMDQAAGLQTLGDVPLVVLTALDGADSDWPGMQDDLMTLSPNSVQRRLPDASHAMVVQNEDAARHASRAILEVVRSVRTGTPMIAQER